MAGVDLSLIQARAQGVMTGPRLVVLDRIALRKSWARKGQSSYWVDLVKNMDDDLMQVVRSWRWLNKQENKVTEGHVGSDPTTDEQHVADTFKTLVEFQLTRDYVIDERQRDLSSPAPANLTFAAPPPAKPPAVLPNTTVPVLMAKKRTLKGSEATVTFSFDPPDEPPPKPSKMPTRKGKFDLW